MNVCGQLLGAASISYGLWQVWEPLTWITAGAALMLVTFGLEGGKK